jgi:uncharacterized membrane protein
MPGSTTRGRRWEDQDWDTSTDSYEQEGREASSRGMMSDPHRMARGLGWFSVGLGLAQVTAPRRVARLVGMPETDANANTMFAFGLREIASGIGILTRERPVVPMWARVGGDVMDLAVLGRALGSNRSEKNRVAAATAAVLGVTLMDWVTGQALSRESQNDRQATGTGRHTPLGKEIRIRRAITVWAPIGEVYNFWRNFENLPRFMQHLESVRILDERRSHWKAKAPAGTSVEWDAEMIEDRPNELISWRSIADSEIPNQGTVRFLPGPEGGTEVHVDLSYEAPGGRFGSIIAKLFGEEPDIQVGSDLRRFKQVIELGEVVHSDATVHGHPHPAQPSKQPVQPQMQGGTR